MAQRYSAEATEKKRLKNFERWKNKAISKWGSAFSYDPSSETYISQKEAVDIICADHGQFTTTPAQHFMQKGGGCPRCGQLARSASKIEQYRESIQNWIDNDLPKHLEVIDEVKSAGAEVRVRCLRHNAIKTTTINYLKNNNTHGCEICARERTVSAHKLSTDTLVELYSNTIPDHVHIIRRTDETSDFTAEMLCDLHGEFTVNITTLRTGTYLCPECRRRNAGYTSQRLQRLIDEKSRGRPTWLGILHVNVFGIDSLKVGVTVRTLEDRYKWHLKKIFYAVQLDEVSAYTFENIILEKFQEHRDLRIFKKGMREGSRWAGDTELVYLGQRDSVVDYLKELLDAPDADYGAAQRAVDRMQASRSNVNTAREKDLSSQQKAVIGFHPETLSIVERFDSMADAKRAGFSNVPMAVSWRRAMAGGLIWLTEDQFESDQSMALLIKKQNVLAAQQKYRGTPVFCVDSGTHYHSSIEASKAMVNAGFAVNSSHITSVCRGKRPHAAGYRWQYSDLSHEQIEALIQPSEICVPTVKVSNTPKKIYAYEDESGAFIGIYNSQSEAARQLGFSGAGTISTAIKNGKPVKGLRFYTEIQ